MAIRLQQIFLLCRQRVYLGGVSRVAGFRGAQQNGAALRLPGKLPGDDKHRAPIPGRLQIIDAAIQPAVQHQVSALHQLDVHRAHRWGDARQYLIYPGTGGIHHHGCRAGVFLFMLPVTYPPARFLPILKPGRGNKHGLRFDPRTQGLSRSHYRTRQCRVIGLCILILEYRPQPGGFKPVQRLPLTAWQTTKACVPPNAAQQGIKSEARPHQPTAARRVGINRDKKRAQPHQPRGILQQQRAFTQTLPHQRKLPVLKITQTTMNQFAGTA